MEPSPFTEQLAAFVRDERRRSRLTQTELAHLAQVGRRFISDVERGKASLRLGNVEDVLRVLGGRLRIEVPGTGVGRSSGEEV